MFENVALAIQIFVPVGAWSSPKKKVKPNEGEKQEKKSERCTTESKSQCSQGSFWNAWLSQFGWLAFNKENQTMKCCVCTDANLWSCLNILLYNIPVLQKNFNNRKSLKKLVSCSKERRAGNLEKLAVAADLLKVLRAWGKITKTGVSAPSRVRKNGEPWCLICFGY